MAGIDKEFSGEAWAAEGIKVGYLAQEPLLDNNLNVFDNIMLGFGSMNFGNYTDITYGPFICVRHLFTSPPRLGQVGERKSPLSTIFYLKNNLFIFYTV